MPKEIEELLKKYRQEIEKVCDNHINKVILYGSYARGNYNQDSNIDIMPLVQNIRHFDYQKKAYVFYSNVEKEGVSI